MNSLDVGGQRIRELRRRLGMSQEALADAVGVSRSAVAQWETGRAGQLSRNLARLASTLDVPVTKLLGKTPRNIVRKSLAADEAAMLQLFRDADGEVRRVLLRTARRLAKARRP